MAKPPVPPFYENWDDTHCSQCVLRGVLEAFEPQETFDWDLIDRMSGKIEGKWTWPFRQQISLLERGYQVTAISDTSPQVYLDKGVYEVLLERLGREGANKQRQMSDLDAVRADMEEYMRWIESGKLIRHNRLVTMEDVEGLILEGYLVSSSINLKKMNGQEGYNSHAVLIYALEDDHVIFHDSGLPARPSRRLTKAEFVTAATSPNAVQWNLRAYRKNVA